MVPTRLLSNHTTEAGIGFPFNQTNPPGPMPEAIGYAYNLYSAWSFGQSSEPLPELRKFILDRSNLSSIGKFSVKAVETRKTVNCSAHPIEVIGDLQTDKTGSFNMFYNVATSSMGNVQLRAQTQLTLWVDQITGLSDSRAVTRVMFAALGGDIEGGHENALYDRLKHFCVDSCYTPGIKCCSSISSLACDIDIELFDGLACTNPSECDNVNTTLTSMETLRTPWQPWARYTWEIAAYMAAAPTVFGLSVYGRQRKRISPSLTLLMLYEPLYGLC
jgi:hypothetical protein